MKVEENWPRGFRGEVQRCGQTDGQRMVSDDNSTS